MNSLLRMLCLTLEGEEKILFHEGSRPNLIFSPVQSLGSKGLESVFVKF